MHDAISTSPKSGSRAQAAAAGSASACAASGGPSPRQTLQPPLDQRHLEQPSARLFWRRSVSAGAVALRFAENAACRAQTGFSRRAAARVMRRATELWEGASFEASRPGSSSNRRGSLRGRKERPPFLTPTSAVLRVETFHLLGSCSAFAAVALVAICLPRLLRGLLLRARGGEGRGVAELPSAATLALRPRVLSLGASAALAPIPSAAAPFVSLREGMSPL
mmetsp:Transcript_27469/g.65065  ORF Transcript_27469/g.65065 Transcript_27469/m.65065 type:complete len:222 (+) Transcript_27469:1991-2656(+)